MSVSEKSLINRQVERVSAEQVHQAAEYQAAILAPHMAVAGPAVTVEVRPGDNLAIHAAMAVAQPGDVLVVDGKGDLTCALLGEIMATQAQASGIAGIIIDGAVRDADTLSKGHYPVFAAGLNPCGPTKSIPGRVNHPRPLSPWPKGNSKQRPDVLLLFVRAIYVHTGLTTRCVRQACYLTGRRCNGR